MPAEQLPVYETARADARSHPPTSAIYNRFAKVSAVLFFIVLMSAGAWHNKEHALHILSNVFTSQNIVFENTVNTSRDQTRIQEISSSNFAGLFSVDSVIHFSQYIKKGYNCVIEYVYSGESVCFRKNENTLVTNGAFSFFKNISFQLYNVTNKTARAVADWTVSLFSKKNAPAFVRNEVSPETEEAILRLTQTETTGLFTEGLSIATSTKTQEIVFNPIDEDTLVAREQVSQLEQRGLTAEPTMGKQTIVEKIVERVIAGITPEDVALQLNALENKLRQEIFKVSESSSGGIRIVERQVSLTNKIDQLPDVTLINATVSGNFTGLTDAHVPDDITVAGAFSSSGGMLTGALTGTDATFSGMITASGLTSLQGGFVSSASSSITTLHGDNFFASSTIVSPIFLALDTIATSTFSGFLDVTGTNSTSTFSGGLAANALSVTGTATSTFEGGITFAGGNVNLATNGVFLINDSLILSNNTLGSSVLNSSLTSVGTLSSLTVSGLTSLQGGFISSASSSITTLHGDNFFASSTIVADGQALFALTGGSVGIGTTSPSKRLSVSDEVSDAQVAIAYDATRYAHLQVDSAGDLIIDAQGGDIRFNDENLFVCSGGACPTGTPTGQGNLIVETALGIGSSSPYTTLDVAGSAAFTGTIDVQSSSATSTFGHGISIGGTGSIRFPDGTFQRTAASGGTDVQTFTSSGTWTKPSSGSVAQIECWGGGGSGGKGTGIEDSGGGGGGGYARILKDLTALGATETVTIGAGGAAVTGADASGTAGGNTTFGSHLTAYGGGGGFGNNNTGGGGGGGGWKSAGSTGIATEGSAGGNNRIGDAGGAGGVSSDGGNSDTGGGGGGGLDKKGGSSFYGGGGGGSGAGGGDGTNNRGGNSGFGGGGGGAGDSIVSGTGGTSDNGGAGGAGGTDVAGTAGSQPGGGGGGANDAASGAGGAGQCRVTTW